MTSEPEADGPSKQYRIAGMDCGSCAITLESALQSIPGVLRARVSVTTETAEVVGHVPAALIDQKLRQLGYRLASSPNRDATDRAEPSHGHEPAQGAERRDGLAGFARFCWQRGSLRIASVATAAALVAAAATLGAGASPDWLDWLYVLIVLVVGAPILMKGLRAAFVARRITIDLLMGIAALGALAIGEAGEAATVILLFTLGEALEAYSAERSRESLRSIVALQPVSANLLQQATASHARDHGYGHEHGHGPSCTHDRHDHDDHQAHHDDHDHAQHHESDAHPLMTTVPIAAVAVGDCVLVRPGERIPVDGVIAKGVSTINQAAVTGESLPVLRNAGDAVMSGTLNGEGALEITVTRPASDSTISRIARLVEQAQSQRSPAERWVDRFARWYTPLVVALAALVVLVPVLLWGEALLDQANGERGWLYRGLTLLIIACPCALVISIPVTVVSALTRLAGLGVLVKGGAQLDRLADVRVIAFDKTGTLTRGQPAVSHIRAVDCSHEATTDIDCQPCNQLVAIAASVEVSSEHPIGCAIVESARHRGLQRQLLTATSVRAHVGHGVSGEMDDGSRIAVGSEAMLAQSVSDYPSMAVSAEAVRRTGATVMFVARNDRLVGFIGVEDQVRDTASAAIRLLKTLEPSPHLAMLTGDHAWAADRVAVVVGSIDEVQAALTPADKLASVTELRARYGGVAMVGDGINDAPALASADVGISMGRAASAQAIETADIVLVQDDLGRVGTAIRIARRSRQLIQQNVILSLGLKLAFLALAVPGLTTLWLAVVADVGATLIVTLNGMRILRES